MDSEEELQQYLRNSPDIAALNQDLVKKGSTGRKKKEKQPQSKLARRMLSQIEMHDLGKMVMELRFHPVRRWRFDFAWPDLMLALEVNGGTWIRGRHNRGSSIWKDYEKINEAQLLGWAVLQFTTDQVKDGTAIKTLVRAIEQRRENKNGQNARDKDRRQKG